MPLPDPIRWDSKIVLVKIEGTYGTDSAPDGAANAMLLKNVEFRPMEGQDVARNIERPFMGAQEEFPAGLYGVLSGEFELVGSGETGVAPAWGPMVRACGVAEVVTPDGTPGDGTVEYTPVSDGHESVSIHFYIGTTRHILKGARGTLDLTLAASGLPGGKVTLTGLFTTPANQARPTVDLSAFVVPEIVSDATTPDFKINTIDFALRDFTFSLGNTVTPRLLVNRETIVIGPRAESISATVEAQPLTAFNPYAVAQARTRVPVLLNHGTTAGGRFKFEAATCTLKRLSGLSSQDNTLEWPLALTPLQAEGDDQWKITLT